MKPKSILILLAILIPLSGCKSFMYGYTKDLAFDAYHIVKSDKKDFGNRRIRYNMGLHKNSELYYFLLKYGNPEFIHEYETASKCDVIELFYNKKDSVYIFEEPKKSNLFTILKESRPINTFEKLTYKNLLDE